MNTQTKNPTSPSILASLRALIPSRDCDFAEALTVAERQATKLGELLQSRDRHKGQAFEGIELRHIAGLPRLRIVYDCLPVSGMSYWNGHEWIVAISMADNPARQRFTLLHELKHIIDHGSTTRLYSSRQASFRGRSAGGGFTPAPSGGASPSSVAAEQAADYFAGCALVPKAALKRAWGNGMQRLTVLADHFGVSEAAMQVRLDQTGLSREVDPEPAPRRERCARPVHTPSYYPQRFRVAKPGYGRRSYA